MNIGIYFGDSLLSWFTTRGRDYGIDFWQGLQILYLGFLFKRL